MPMTVVTNDSTIKCSDLQSDISAIGGTGLDDGQSPFS